MTGQAQFEWLEDQRFLIQRSHYDHPEIPDAIAVTGIIDGKPSMHYFDPRGVHRVFAVDITADTWRFWNDAPGFSQRFTNTLSDDGNAINSQGELSTDDGATWEHDLAITYRRMGGGLPLPNRVGEEPKSQSWTCPAVPGAGQACTVARRDVLIAHPDRLLLLVLIGARRRPAR